MLFAAFEKLAKGLREDPGVEPSLAAKAQRALDGRHEDRIES
jgi:hypothetical protein